MNPTAKPSSPPTTPGSGWADPNFTKNWNKMPPAEMLRWAGCFVACSWDGSRILTGAETRESLDEQLKSLGIDPKTVIIDYIDAPGESNL